MANEVDVTHLPRTEDLVALFVWFVPVIFLLLWDVWKAWKRRAFWIPGQAFVLSALIIQLLSFIDYSHISVYSGSRYQTEEVKAILVKNELVIDSGRLMMCVLIAYLLPGMARSGFITVRSDLTALVLSITFHVVSEPRSVWKVEKRNESLSALAALSEVFDGKISNFASTFLIVAIIYLLLLLILATMIGRSIRRIMSLKIPSALSCCTHLKDHVLKCWIVARLSQPDYVLVRSGLCSMVSPTVTACIGVHIIKWTYVQFTDNESLNSVTKRTLVQFVIVLIGWIVLIVRGVTSDMQGNIFSGYHVYGMSVEDLEAYFIRLFVRDKRIREKRIRALNKILIVVIGWIVLLVRGVTSDMQGIICGGYYVYGMSMEDALTGLSAYFIRLFVWDKRIQEKRIRDMNKKIRDMNKKIRDMNKKIRDIPSLWNPPHWVEKLFEIFSMQYPAHWVRIIKQKLAHPFQNAEVDDPQFFVYRDTLNGILIPGESAMKLWKANRWGFRKVEERMRQGDTDGRYKSPELISFLRTRTREDDRVKEDMQRANKNSWKRTAVSFIHFMIYYFYDVSDASVIEYAMQCYIQAWEYMNFVDGLNKKVKSLGRQADNEFDSLQQIWHNREQPGMLETMIQAPLCELIEEENRSNEGRPNPRDSTEAAKFCLFDTWKIINPHLSAPEINKIHRLQRVLANVYFFYMTEGLKEAVLQKCSKLAEEGMEEEILDVAFLAAKAQGLLDEFGGGNDIEDQIPKASPNSEGQGGFVMGENNVIGHNAILGGSGRPPTRRRRVPPPAGAETGF